MIICWFLHGFFTNFLSKQTIVEILFKIFLSPLVEKK